MLGHLGFQSHNVFGVGQQIEHVLLGTHGALDAAQRVVLQEELEGLVSTQQLFAEVGEALAEGDRLSRHVVTAAGHGQANVCAGPLRHVSQAGHHSDAQQLE